MAKKVKFSGSKPKPKGGSTFFNFGFNTLSKGAKKAYRKAAGHGGGS